MERRRADLMDVGRDAFYLLENGLLWPAPSPANSRTLVFPVVHASAPARREVINSDEIEILVRVQYQLPLQYYFSLGLRICKAAALYGHDYWLIYLSNYKFYACKIFFF